RFTRRKTVLHLRQGQKQNLVVFVKNHGSRVQNRGLRAKTQSCGQNSPGKSWPSSWQIQLCEGEIVGILKDPVTNPVGQQIHGQPCSCEANSWLYLVTNPFEETMRAERTKTWTIVCIASSAAPQVPLGKTLQRLQGMWTNQ
ncbi:hypothetical protein KI387_003560, partial [Taxus chinensis]